MHKILSFNFANVIIRTKKIDKSINLEKQKIKTSINQKWFAFDQIFVKIYIHWSKHANKFR